METLYAERGGYFFDPESEIEMARDCAKSFQKYTNQADQKKKKK